MRRPKRTPAEILDAAESNGARPVGETDINGDLVPNVYQPGTEVNYRRMMDLWDDYARRYPNATPHDLQTFKHFVDYCVRGWNATQNRCRKTNQCKKIAYSTVRQRITEFLAAWQCRTGNQKIPSEVSRSIYNHMKGARFQVTVSPLKRERHYLTVAYYRILMEHMWAKDWYQYDHGGTQVNDYAIHTFSIYSSSRVGEWIESSARKGSGRGLFYKASHMNFVVFRNERGEAETAVCPIRDAKGMTCSPEGRPQHGMYEDIEPLFACAMLPALAIAIANDAFQDYHSVEEIFAIPPPMAGTVQALRIKEEMLEAPFFQKFTSDGPTGVIEKAMTFSNRMVNLGHRAGFEANLTMHCERREVLVKAASNGYVKDDRKKLAGHRCNAFLSSYASSISTIDGVANFWGLTPRTSHLEAFRGLSLQWHPQMEQSLPAKVQDDLAQRPDFVALSRQIRDLGEKMKGIITDDEMQTARNRRDELYIQRRKLMSDELNKWQKLQSGRATDDKSQVASRPSFFNRIRRLDPPRNRLASALFLSVPLRSKEGQNALRDMIALYTDSPTVAYHQALQPVDGHCPVATCNRQLETIPAARRWVHLFRCYSESLKRQSGFAEFCMQCDQWSTSARQWDQHCQHHIDDYETLPVQFNQINFRYTPATAAQCPFCLFDPSLSAPLRWKQFRNTQDWKDHVSKHLSEEIVRQQKLDRRKALACPDPRCGLSFDSVYDLRYHCQDTHCLSLADPIPSVRDVDGALAQEDPNSRTFGIITDTAPDVVFVHETTTTVLSLCVDQGHREQDTRPKRQRGRPSKQEGVLPRLPVLDRETSLAERSEMSGTCCDEPRSIPRSVGPKCQLGVETRRKSLRLRALRSSVASSRSPAHPRTDKHRLEFESGSENLSNPSLSDSDFDPSRSTYKMCGVGNRRKRRR